MIEIPKNFSTVNVMPRKIKDSRPVSIKYLKDNNTSFNVILFLPSEILYLVNQ